MKSGGNNLNAFPQITWSNLVQFTQ